MFNRMQRVSNLLILFLVAVSCAGALRAEESKAVDAEALLKRSDTFRNGWPSYVLKVKITNYESDKSDEEKLYTVSQKGADKTYVEFMSPRDKGRHLLMLGDDMWIYLPDTSRPIRITPLERLSGDASNGDVARTNYAVDYSPVYCAQRSKAPNSASSSSSKPGAKVRPISASSIGCVSRTHAPSGQNSF